MKLCDLPIERVKPGIKLVGAKGTPGMIVSYGEMKINEKTCSHMVRIRWENGQETIIALDPDDPKDVEMWQVYDKVTVVE